MGVRTGSNELEIGKGIAVTLYIPELTINWHILEACNMKCGYCYAKFRQHSRFRFDYPTILEELSRLKGRTLQFNTGTVTVGSIRLNFAGGEPFLFRDKGLYEAIILASELGMSPSFISNGSLVTDDFIREYGPLISVAGFSVDSFDREINARIGRQDNKGGQVGLDRLKEIFTLFRQVSSQTKLKVNTVVCRENLHDDLNAPLRELQPDRWKALKVIPIHGAEDNGITDEQYRAFLERHKGVGGRIVHEDNDHMHRSYIMLDPDGCFYQREGSSYDRSGRVSEIGAFRALDRVEFDPETYLSRY